MFLYLPFLAKSDHTAHLMEISDIVYGERETRLPVMSIRHPSCRWRDSAWECIYTIAYMT